MSDTRGRVRAIQAIVAGSTLSSSALHTAIQTEFGEVYRCRRVRREDRRRLLQVLHSTRALDTSLKEFTALHGCSPPTRSLGGYLTCLTNGCGSLTRLPDAERRTYQTSIVNVRNTLIHEAGAVPLDDAEILGLLSEMERCLLRVVSL